MGDAGCAMAGRRIRLAADAHSLGTGSTLAEMTPIYGKPWKLTKRISFHCLFTLAFNVTGQPAISLPMH